MKLVEPIEKVAIQKYLLLSMTHSLFSIKCILYNYIQLRNSDTTSTKIFSSTVLE